jgi:hypothetical protein
MVVNAMSQGRRHRLRQLIAALTGAAGYKDKLRGQNRESKAF